MINRKQFSRKFAETYNVTYQMADQLCRDVFELVGKILYEDKEDINIQGFGTFKRKVAKPRNIRHPGTGEVSMVPGREFVKFTPSELLENKNKE